MKSKCDNCSHCIWDEYGFGECELNLDEETCDEEDEITLYDYYSHDEDLQLMEAEYRSGR